MTWSVPPRGFHALTRTISTSLNVWSRLSSVTRRIGDTSIDPQVLDSGEYQDVCPDCGTTIVGATLDEVLGTDCACQDGRTYRYLTELVCMLCSRVLATAVTCQPKAPILVPRRLRCLHCGGQPLPGETVRQVLYPSVPIEPARRGRPPRWLVEQRRQNRSAS